MSNYRDAIMSHIVIRPIHRQALLGAAALALAASIIAYQRSHPFIGASDGQAIAMPAAAEPDLPTIVISARREPVVGETFGDRETPSARRLAARSATAER
jgi:hypothetical protein